MDVDGVLADFALAAIELVRRVTGRQYKPEDIKTWEVFDSIPEPQAKKEVYRILKEPGGCSSIPVYPEALEGIQKLRELVYIIAVTSPFSNSPTWMHEREQWLERHFGDAISYTIHAKHKERIHGDFLVDDKPEHVVAWANYWLGPDGCDSRVVPILWNTYRTEETLLPPQIRRASTWAAVHQIVHQHAHRFER